ncbi:hypothetical protein [Chryseobacterium profundimaris]|uniref:Lipocalin-like domain-containing protein n=1 Tax=Chryseobacterium profundimaris TaxID=1387275 RepID=A0ABY1NXC0_9FLAO|nr:hypothetical protein [Chryseobacterium profundimaris]SMP21106.1 hypothetical protein SAMN06264346_1068 [Chryseobacterium profundimaris]
MRTKLNYLFILITFAFLHSCGNPKPQLNDFVGTWKSKDNAHIILNQNGTCILKGVNYFKINTFPKNNNTKLNTEGTWRLVNNVDSGIIDGINNGISIVYTIPKDRLKGEIIFYISGHGLTGNNPPWSLFIWDGDPDDMNRYEFTKE